MQRTLTEIRQEIDLCDRTIIEAVKTRLVCVHDVARVKTEQGLPVWDGVREAALLEKTAALAADAAPVLTPVYRTLMACARRTEVTPAEPADRPAGTVRMTLPSSALWPDVMAAFAAHEVTPAALQWAPPMLTVTFAETIPGSLIRDLLEHHLTLEF